MIELVLGILIGTVSGLIPGIHSNTLSALLVAYSGFLLNLFSPSQLPMIIFASAVTHTFVDILPTVFTGIPEEDTAIAVLPAHDMVLEGRGVEAVSLSALASLGSFLMSLPIFFIFLKILEMAKDYIYISTFYFLLLAAIFIILSEKDPFEERITFKKRSYALAVFLTSGVVGLVALENASLAEMSVASSVLLPLLTGLFGSPALMVSIAHKTDFPPQVVNSKAPSLTSVLGGCFSGSLVSIFPGVTSGTATALASAGMKNREEYISSLSAANTSNAILCFAVFLAMGKVRSGAVDAISTFSFPSVSSLIIAGIFIALIATQITILLAIGMSRVLYRVNFTLFSSIALIFLILLIFILTGWFGLLIFAIATPVGLSPLFLEVRRIHGMGCLMLPVMLTYAPL